MLQPRYIYIDEVGSTNDFLRQYSGDEEMVVAVADYQQAGRGCGSNSWESERGKNLTFSILFHPEQVLAHEQYVLSMAVAVTMRKYLSKVLSEEVCIKWPNDIYVGDLKIAGILIENRLVGNLIRNCVVGIGLNVNQVVFTSDAPNPVSMAQLEGREWDREEVLHGIVQQFVWQLEHFRRDKIREKYRRHLYRREGFFFYRDAGGTFEAELVAVEDDGHLVLRDKADNLRTYAFKEVQFLVEMG